MAHEKVEHEPIIDQNRPFGVDRVKRRKTSSGHHVMLMMMQMMMMMDHSINRPGSEVTIVTTD